MAVAMSIFHSVTCHSVKHTPSSETSNFLGTTPIMSPAHFNSLLIIISGVQSNCAISLKTAHLFTEITATKLSHMRDNRLQLVKLALIQLPIGSNLARSLPQKRWRALSYPGAHPRKISVYTPLYIDYKPTVVTVEII